MDADGNEIAGIILPEVAVPIATHTGWTLRHPDIGGAEQLLVFAGATLPFPRTQAEGAASGDPRTSVEERYASREGIWRRCDRSRSRSVASGYLLEEGRRPVGGGRRALWDPFPDPDRIHRGEP